MKHMPRSQAIKKICIGCGEPNSAADRKNCVITDCPLYPYREGGCPTTTMERLKAVHNYCRECMGDQQPHTCHLTECPLHEHRCYSAKKHNS